MSVDYATCDECGESVDKDSAVTWTRRLSPLKVSYRHPECYDPWAEEGPPIPEWHKVKPEEVRVTSSTGGQKGQKLARYDLIPSEALRKVAELYGIGAEKYEPNNWRRGYDWSLSFAAMQRHAWQFWGGEDFDAESGSPHLASVVFHALAMLTFMDEHRSFDDRPRVANDDSIK